MILLWLFTFFSFFVEAHILVLLSGWSIFVAEELRIQPICAHTEFILPNNHPFTIVLFNSSFLSNNISNNADLF
jgi:hypothetical protein